MRKIFPWVGKTDDDKVPLNVQLRVLEKQGGRCAITGRKFTVGETKHLDHKIPLADGGRHAECNLQWILSGEHAVKTADEASQRAKVRRKAAKHAGIARPKAEKAPKKPLSVAAGMPEIMRRFR